MKFNSKSIFFCLILACVIMPLVLAQGKKGNARINLSADTIDVDSSTAGMPAAVSKKARPVDATSFRLGKEFLGDRRLAISEQDKEKAEYIFMEAERQKAKGNIDAFFDLLRQAHAIDPTNSAVSYYLGYCMLSMDNSDNIRQSVGLALMQQHFKAKPSDYYESYFYGDACQKLGHKDQALNVWKTLAPLFPAKPDVQYQLADAYASNGDFHHAIASYDSIEQTEGKSIQLTAHKVNFYMMMSDTAGALKEGHALLATAPANAQYNLLMGNVFMEFNKNDSALSYFDRAQRLEPDNGYAYMAKANYYNTIGDSVNYDKQIYQALVSNELDVDSKLGVLTDYTGKLLQQRDSSERVNNLFKVLLNQHPHEGKIHELYSQYFLAKQDYKNAAEQIGYALDIDPTNADEWKQLMMVNLMAENFPKAIEAAQKALEYNPDNINLYQYIAPAYYQMKQYDKALEIYQKAIAIADSSDIDLHSNLLGGMADVYYSKGDTTLAFKTYEDALAISPGNTSVLNNYAYFLSVTGKDLDKAERMSGLAVKANPTNSTFLDTYAWIYFKKGEYKLALTYIESALSNNKTDNADIFEHYADILFMSGQPEKAVTYWEKALKLNPDSDILAKKVKFKTYFYK